MLTYITVNIFAGVNCLKAQILTPRMLCFKGSWIFFSKLGSLVISCKSLTNGSLIYSCSGFFCVLKNNLKMDFHNYIDGQLIKKIGMNEIITCLNYVHMVMHRFTFTIRCSMMKEYYAWIFFDQMYSFAYHAYFFC